VPEGTRINLTGGEGGTFSTNNGKIALGQPVMSQTEFATVADSTTGVDQGMQIAANVIGVLGGIGTNSKKDFTFTADPAKYKAGAVEALNGATSALVGKAQSLR